MLYINPNTKVIKNIAETHFDTVKCVIRKRVGSKIKCGCKICKGSLTKVDGITESLKKIFEDESTLQKLILASPENLLSSNDLVFKEIFGGITLNNIEAYRNKHNAYKSDQRRKEKNRKNQPVLSKDERESLDLFKSLSAIIDYNKWFNKLNATADYGPYKLADKLNFRSCTYCNRQYTISVQSATNDSGKLTRPQFDHWISKDDYPLLALSFYNLIPSCPTCNSSVKGNTKFNPIDFVHPYLDDVVDHIQFSFEYWISIDKYDVRVTSNHSDSKQKGRINKTLNAFKIEEVYNGHHPELDDLVRMSKAYSPEYLRILKTSFPNANLTDEQIYRFAFGTELNSDDFHKRPLSKFKHDILEQLGVIRKTNSSSD